MLNPPLVDGSRDVERGTPTLERVLLTVRGLKCGCCEQGVSKALEQIPAIKNSLVNIVLAKIEFDLDTTLMSISQVISQLHRATGFIYERQFQADGQILELLVNDPNEIFRTVKPTGVDLVDTDGKKPWCPMKIFSGRNSPSPVDDLSPTLPPNFEELRQARRLGALRQQYSVQIHYDAAVIGARKVFEYYHEKNPNEDLQLAPPAHHPSIAIGAKQAKQACVLFAITAVFTIPVLVFAWGPVNETDLAYSHASLALSTAVQIIAFKEFVPGAFRGLIYSGLFDMDLLIALSTTTSYVYSVVSYAFLLLGKPLETGSFFETSTLLTALILLGRVVNEFARFKAAKSVSIRSLQVDDALLIMPGREMGPGQPTRKIDARLLQYGDCFKVPPHTAIVTDGKVIYGGSEVDESMITGESRAVAKGLDHLVHAGTVNGTGQLIVELTKLPHENSISEIATMVENAELSKPKIQALANKIAGWFIPAITAIGLTVFLVWLFVQRFYKHLTWRNSAIEALTYAIATLIVSCPCAIGLAVPMVVLIAGGVAARYGIIFRDPQKLEVALHVTDIVFDKTGTLSTGKLHVTEGQFHGTYQAHIKQMIMGLLEGDQHPVAIAVQEWLENDARTNEKKAIAPIKMENISSIPGKGIRGICKESRLEIRAGNPMWLNVSMVESQHTLFCVTVSGVLSATFRLSDHPRHDAEQVIKLLMDRRIKTHMISGDGEGAVKDMALNLNIPKCRTRWRFNPDDKQRYVHSLQKEGSIVLFCGDGTNDSAALKQADIGVHINHGSDVAKSAADVVLMKSRLFGILILLDISKAAYRRILANFGWSFVYNTLAILLAAGAFVKVRIQPAYAGLGELVSVLPVVLIAFQLRWTNYGQKYRKMIYGHSQSVLSLQEK
ncbi:E1-E2 ATPase-domain-containing protein [Dendryphion nanum]|uniref:E1-E2 ATPase-domain-containing protein n=1 Tax=Dendryphion nanum TaxID=256645 RepID=A0A9P9EG24_9PLEO|nr:E1-E2 ATPase-domain-containing protein [Dendryphion nanum]